MLLFSGALILVTMVAMLFATPLPSCPVRERIRREVHEEFEASIQKAAGLRRWWLIRKRQREISRRLGQVIYAARGAVPIAAPPDLNR